MSPPDDLYPPPTHGTAWSVVALVAVALVAAWWVGLWWRTRSQPDRTGVWTPLRGRALATRRARGLAELDAIAADHAAGRVTTRDAFQRLSPVVRRFVFDAAGVPAHTMTLAELQREQPGLLADVVALMYPAEFAAVVEGDVGLGVARARAVIVGWTSGPPSVTNAVGAAP